VVLDRSAPVVSHRSPTFTLGTALAWLGHECPGSCPVSGCDWRASAWFVQVPLAAGPTWTLVDVDFLERPSSDDEVAVMLREVNQCVKREHIRVRERSAGGGAAVFAAAPVRGLLA
jgi:hypothetical protein